jgi:hypothetical protein
LAVPRSVAWLHPAVGRINLIGMKTNIPLTVVVGALLLSSLACGQDQTSASAKEQPALPKACIDGTGPGWRELGEADFVNVNCDKETWSFKDGGIQCTGQPVGVIRSTKPLKNFELVVEWKHLKSEGNSGVFLWGTEASLTALAKGEGKGRLPQGIEVQVLDNGYKEAYEQRTGKKADFFTTHGDVFATGNSKLTPFAPTSPNGSRSFPRKELSKGVGQWNHYYIRAINGEVRLWVNGEEVSGGNGADPAEGFLCLESEGSPIEFRHLRIRELP